jgi:hypothetical protein
MRTATLLIVVSLSAPALAALPAPSEEAKAQAAAAKAKSDWGDKVAAYKLCREQDRVAERYRATHDAKAAPREAVPACADPGPFVADAKDAKRWKPRARTLRRRRLPRRTTPVRPTRN